MDLSFNLISSASWTLQKRDREQIKTGPQAPFFGRGLAVAGADGTLGIMGMEASPDGIFKSWSLSCCKQPCGHHSYIMKFKSTMLPLCQYRKPISFGLIVVGKIYSLLLLLCNVQLQQFED